MPDLRFTVIRLSSLRPLVRRSCWLVLILCSIQTIAQASAVSDYVIQISVDGLGSSYLQSLINEGRLPTFKRLQAEGAWTHNARTDFDYTITLPNHTCMITGRSVMDKAASPTA